LLLFSTTAIVARGAGPGDELLRLAPPNAGAVLVVEDLRGHAAAFTQSPFSQELAALPAVKAWRNSPAFAQFTRARTEIEAALKTDLRSLRDDLLGDAFVLALEPGAGNDPTQARGLLLSHVRDRGLLERLLGFMNDGESRDGRLIEVAKRERTGAAYQHRRFRPGTKPDEWYVVLDGGVFAWANSEALIQGVVDRAKGSSQGLTDQPLFRRARSALPAHCLANFFVDPRFAEQIVSLGAASSGNPPNPAVAAAIGRYVKSLNYVALGLEWREGFFVHGYQLHDPDRVPEALKNWATADKAASAAPPVLPANLLAVATTSIDLPALFDSLLSLAPESGRARIDNVMTIISGILYGKDVRRDVLPRLGPKVWVVARPPIGDDQRLSIALAVRIQGSNGAETTDLAPALENGLRTFLAAMALDPKHGGGRERVETQAVEGARVTALSGPASPFAFTVKDRQWLILGTSREAVGALGGAGTGGAATEFEANRARDVGDCETFAYVDLIAVTRWASAHKAAVARRLAEKRGGSLDSAQNDLEQALALIRLCRSAFIANRVAPDYSSASQIVGIRLRNREEQR
jgi:hypothetical protein